MAKELYRDLGHTIGRYRCVSLDAHDKMLSGPKGWICTYGPDRLVAYTGERGGNEKINPFEIKYLDRWISRIGGLGRIQDQAHWTNNPAERHK